MHLGLHILADFFEHRPPGSALALAVVTGTEGSTYRKAGALMLIDDEGRHAGMISGGCLEDDLAGHAGAAMAEGRARTVDYDLHDDPELVLGLGLGCGGDVHVLVTPLDARGGMETMERLFAALSRGRACRLGIVRRTESPSCEPGDLAMVAGSRESHGAAFLCDVLAEIDTHAGPARTHDVAFDAAGGGVDMLVIDIPPPPLVLICGAGPDAPPMAAQVRSLGWRCTVTDHRPAYAVAERFQAGVDVVTNRPGRLPDDLLEDVDAAIVMSHHLEHDEHYLRQLGERPPRYVGLLGPARRRAELEQRLGSGAPPIHGPAGLDIGAEMPEAIALSIMAEIHARLNGREGRPLGDG